MGLIKNFRRGFATNSSSSHSFVYMKQPQGNHDSWVDTEFGWNDFRLNTVKEKLMYVLTDRLYRGWDKNTSDPKEAMAIHGSDFPELDEQDFQAALNAMFAISGFDIALWDIAAKAQGKPLHALIGPALRTEAQAYASLVRYADTAQIQKHCRDAVAQGYRAIKLHEVDPDVMRAARAACGPDIGISVDVNCAWTPEQARLKIPALQEIGASWLEEPIFPPEDIRNQASLNRQFPLGAGENACTRHEFARIIEAKAVTYLQPSVTKLGGVTEFVAVARMALAHGLAVMPHSPYFGVGYFTTLQLIAGLQGEPLLEHLYVALDGDLAVGGTPLPRNGTVAIPQRPGHGFELDMEVLERYRVGQAQPARLAVADR